MGIEKKLEKLLEVTRVGLDEQRTARGHLKAAVNELEESAAALDASIEISEQLVAKLEKKLDQGGPAEPVDPPVEPPDPVEPIDAFYQCPPTSAQVEYIEANVATGGWRDPLVRSLRSVEAARLGIYDDPEGNPGGGDGNSGHIMRRVFETVSHNLDGEEGLARESEDALVSHLERSLDRLGAGHGLDPGHVFYEGALLPLVQYGDHFSTETLEVCDRAINEHGDVALFQFTERVEDKRTLNPRYWYRCGAVAGAFLAWHNHYQPSAKIGSSEIETFNRGWCDYVLKPEFPSGATSRPYGWGRSASGIPFLSMDNESTGLGQEPRVPCVWWQVSDGLHASIDFLLRYCSSILTDETMELMIQRRAETIEHHRIMWAWVGTNAHEAGGYENSGIGSQDSRGQWLFIEPYVGAESPTPDLQHNDPPRNGWRNAFFVLWPTWAPSRLVDAPRNLILGCMGAQVCESSSLGHLGGEALRDPRYLDGLARWEG